MAVVPARMHLAATRRFDGTVNLIFQPDEEGMTGAAAMIADGLFDRFPCDAVFAYHTAPPACPWDTRWSRKAR